MDREEVIEKVRECVTYAKGKCDEIEFSLEDATRSNPDFACRVIDTAIECGATTINIPDTVGYITNEEFKNFIVYLKCNSRLDEVELSVHCHNDLGLATANSLMAVMCGANQVECTVNGIGERAGNAAMEEVVAAIKTRSDIFDAYTNIDTRKIKMISNMVIEATGSMLQNNKAVVGENAFKHESGIHQAGVISERQTYELMDPSEYGIEEDSIVIGIHSGKAAIVDKIQKMRMNPFDYEVDEIVKDIKSYCESSKIVTDEKFFEIVSANKKYRIALNKAM